MSKLILYSDRVSHPCRACILALGKGGVPFEEKRLDLMKGEHMRVKELPLKKIPVLLDGDFKLAESTSILRYIALKAGNESLYPSDHKLRVKTDECLDFWQSSFNANVLKLVQNSLMYKLMFRMKEPNQKLIQEVDKAHAKDKKVFSSYFLQGKPFVGGSEPSIADIMIAVTLEQSAILGVDHKAEAEFLTRVREAFPDYEDVHKEIKALPDRLKSMKMI